MGRTQRTSRRRSFSSTQIASLVQSLSTKSAEGGGDPSNNLGPAAEGPGTTLPWYLQVATQKELSRPLSLHQKLPDLPVDPPSILQPLLEHVSVELGMDDLTLLDLRNLDPAPALGSNLFMIIGTARSEKHLHVSADRLCRWLRSSYKLRPYADGLLGRNELKIKMRRKLRRAKLLGASGDAMGGHAADDGIRTGWVCVNVGSVASTEAAEAAEPTIDQRSNVVGFGVHTNPVRVVVQLFTGEKREEMDLEGLWGGILERHARKLAREQAALDIERDGGSTTGQEQPQLAQPAQLVPVSPPPLLPAVSTSSTQARSLHTSTRRRFATVRSIVPGNDRDTMGQSQPPMPVALEPEEDQLLRLIDAGEYPKASRMINRFYSHLPSDDRKGLELRAMTNSVLNLPREEAVAVLGKGISDYVSTPFLQSFYNLFPPSPSAIFWHWRVKLCSIALKHGSPGYKSIDLVHLLRQMLLSDVDILEETLLTMLEANLCHARHELALPLDAEFFDKRRQNLTRDVLDDMESRGFQVYNEDIFVMLHEALGTATPVQPPTWIEHHYVFKSPLPPHLPATASLPDPHHRRIRCQLDRLQSLMNHEAVTIMRDDNRIRVLTILANVAYWDSFWDFWAIPAREMLPRSPALYEAMFSIVARTRHQDMCCHTLRARIPEMNSETPAVPLTGPLARAVMRCLAYAEPNIEHDAATTPSLRGEWVRLWRRCEAGLSEETAVGDGDDEDVDDDDDNDDGDDDRLLQRTTATGAQLGDATPSRAGPDVQYV